MENFDYYFWVAFKLAAAFCLILFFFQFSGAKRQLAQMTSIDLISNFILGGILGGYLYNTDITLPGFILIVSAYFLIIYITSYLTNSTAWGRKIMVGVPTIVINNGQLDIEKLKRMKMSMTDFMSLLRNKDVHSLKEVKLAQIEIDGQLTIVKKSDEYFALLLIDNGVINEENLKQIGKTKSWLLQQLKKRKIKKVEDVFCAQWLNKDLYIILSN